MKNPPSSAPNLLAPLIGEAIFPALAGLWLGLVLLKFGNPAILADLLEPPRDALEMVFMPWPAKWGYWLLAAVVLSALPAWRWQTPAPLWFVALPAAWWLWQCLSSLQTVSPALSHPTLGHFTACALSFYLGLFALAPLRRTRVFWLWLLAGFLVVLAVGWHQRFGGLEETRRFFYELPNWRDYSPEFLRKISSNRIYATLFYPNTLAGVILLLLPPLLAAIWMAIPAPAATSNAQRAGKAPLAAAPPVASRMVARIAATALAGIAGLACLYWSGSKAGWLLALGLALVALAHLPGPRRFKLTLVTVLLALGIAGFLIKYADYFSRGATSASARLDYWRVGWQLLKAKPLLGSGPGTFFEGYRRLKAPEAEMTRLAHNDYLQQGADSGVVGLLLYSAIWVVGLAWAYRRNWAHPLRFAVWLGVVGLAAQGLVEFGLYIPATAWPHFLLLGWLQGTNVGQASRLSAVSPR